LYLVVLKDHFMLLGIFLLQFPVFVVKVECTKKAHKVKNTLFNTHLSD